MNATAKLGAYGAVLAVALVAGAVLGTATGPAEPEPNDDHPAHDDAPEEPGGGTPDLPDGLLVSHHGYSLAAEATQYPAPGTHDFRFRVLDAAGDPVHDFEVEHDKELHLIAVSRELDRFVHVHPERDASGTWSIALPFDAPGSYRVYADFAVHGGPSLTLGVDVSVAGDFAPASLPPAATSSTAGDGFDVHLSGAPEPGHDSEVTLRVTRGGAVAALQPYLGASGHLVAIRAGDLAYLHVHPVGADPAAGEVRFAIDVPSAGTYRFYLDFRVDGVVRTAAFTVPVAHAEAG